MVAIENDIFDGVELNEMMLIIDNFNEEYEPTTDEYRNDYHKQQVFLSEELIEKVKIVASKHTSKKIKINSIWINKIDNTDNLNDDYHRDDTDLSFVIYPTKDFKGGDLECIINNKNELFEITTNSAIMIFHKTQHRVKQVIEGVRWSIALFCVYEKTNLI
jgi:hypothetical protein